MATNLENQYIDESYQKLVQISGSAIADGTGSTITSLDITASHAVSASYAVSASHEIVKEISSSYADVAGIADAVSGSNVVGYVANATSSISASHAVSAVSSSYSNTSTSASHALTADTSISASHAATATTASFALNVIDTTFPYQGDAQVTGSVLIKDSGSKGGIEVDDTFIAGTVTKDNVDYYFTKGAQVNQELVILGTNPELKFLSSTATGSMQDDKFIFTDRTTGLVASQYKLQGFLIGSQSRSEFGIASPFVALTSTQTGLANTADTEWGLKYKGTGVVPTNNMLVVDSTTGKMNTQLSLSSSNDITASAFKGDGSGITGVISASYAVTASYALNSTPQVSASYANFATSASHAIKADSADSVAFADITGKPALVSGSSQITLQNTTGNLSGSRISGPVTDAISSSYASTATLADAATSAVNAISASHAVQADSALSATTATTAAFASAAATASYVEYTNVANKPTLVSSSAQIDLAQAFGTASQALTASYIDAADISGSITNAEFAEYANNTIVYGKNMTGTQIEKGTPLYFSASGVSGNVVGVYPADAGNPARMPAAGVAGETLTTPGGEGKVFLDGFLNGVDTSAFNSGDAVYVAVGGGYTNVKPTGSANLIQALGYIEKVDLNGSGVIQGSGRANDVPNITQNYTWVGNANGVATPTAVSSLSVATASLALDSQLLDGKDSTIFATTGSNTFTGKQTINTSYVEQNYSAPGTNQEVAFFNVNGSVVNGKNYNRVFYGQADYPSFGIDYQDYFAIEYYDGFGYNFGTEFSMNGKGARFVAVPSGSGFNKRASIEVQDNYNGTSTINGFGDLAFLTGRNLVQIGDNLGNSIKTGGSGVQITGSNGVYIKDETYIDATLNTRRIHFDKNPFNSTVTNNLGAIRLNADGKTYTNTLYDQSMITSQSLQGMYIDTGSNTLEHYLQTKYSGTINEIKLTNVGSARSIDIDTDTLTITGSAKFADVMNLAAQNPLPAGTLGDLSVSGSGLYFHNGTSWTLIS